MSNMDAAKPGHVRNVAILGGGPAGVAAAFWLSAPEQRGQFQVTLYTQGWRLGGKCASGRHPGPTRRIEEHGLHMLMGCYQNAFATIRACYDEWTPAANNPFQCWMDAFLPQRQVTLMEKDGPGDPPSWMPWDFSNLPALPGQPGDGPVTSAMTSERTATPFKRTDALYPFRMADWLEAYVHVPDDIQPSYTAALTAFREVLFVPSEETTAEALRKLNKANEELDSALTRSNRLTQHAPPLDSRSPANRALILANLGVAISLGYLRDILTGGSDAYDVLNQQEFRAWLRSCWASHATLISAPVRALYDLAFAFPSGNSSNIANGSMAAGVTLRLLHELAFGYRNAPLWKMAAGIGDTVFAPLYDVLHARNVSVQFFSRVTAIRPTKDGRIGEIDVLQQAVTVDGSPYRPLIDVNNIECWPNQPDWAQLENGQVLHGTDFESSFCTTGVGTRTLSLATDFDLVVLALPPAALRRIAGPLAAVSPDWKNALDNSMTVATQSLQVWMMPILPKLGWGLGSTVLTSFAKPESWADMSHVLPSECWTGPGAPQSLAYFCNCLPVSGIMPVNPATMHLAAVQIADGWLNTGIKILWPNWPGHQIAARYDRANFDVSDLYTLTPAGNNVASRFDPGQPAGFSNLYVVGDWTRTRFSGGCFESAVESAMLASRAIGGFPTIIQTS